MNIEELKKLAGINNFKGLQPYEGMNISHTANEKSQYMKKNKIEPGTPDWFRLWFARPYLTGEKPHD